MAVTIKDVAKQAGVSHATVSRALHNSPLISPQTTSLVRKTASEMGYQPSAAARSLKTNRSQVLGVIVSSIDDPFFSEILQGIDDIAQQNGYSLFIAASQKDLEHERHIVRTMRTHRVDGVILCSTPFSLEQSRQLRTYEIPMVVINNQSSEEPRFSIHHDDLDGSLQMTQHLINLGHHRIAYLGFESGGRTNLERLSGYRRQMQQAGFPILAGCELAATISDPSAGQQAAAHFLSLPQPPSAIFCYNDMLAIGLLRGLQEAGVRVPQDISVAGFDNITFSAFTQPALTTFDQPKRTIGDEAARLVLELLGASAPASRHHVLKGRLLVRTSTASPGK